MKKKLLCIGLILIMLISSVCFAYADNLENEENEELDTLFEEIYETCIDMEVNTITDDYSAYAFLLGNMDEVLLEDGKIEVINSGFSSLNDNESIVLVGFVNKINKLVELEAIVLQSNLKIVSAPVPGIENTPMLLAESFDLMEKARIHAEELQEVYDNAPFGTRNVVAGEYFAQRVKSGGAWDYKVFLGTKTKYYIPELDTTMTGETIGNFHYGYVGSTCFRPTMLKTAAGLVQIWSGTSNFSYWDSYFDDPKDTSDIQWGINVYNSEN